MKTLSKKLKRRTIKTPVLYRTATIERADIDEDSRTMNVSFSSEEPFGRYFGIEILDHDKKSVDLSFLNSGRAPLLKDHNREVQTGVIEKSYISKERMGRADVRFGKSAVADAEFNDVNDGIRSNVSVGYRINKMVLEESNDESGDTYRVTDWMPLEISLVSIPADQTVGVGRDDSEREFNTEIYYRGGYNMTPEEKAKAEAEAKAKAEQELKAKAEAEAKKKADSEAHAQAVVQVREDETARVTDIIALGQAHNLKDEAMEAVKTGKSVDQFRQLVLDKLGAEVKPVAMGHRTDPSIGMSGNELSNYSFIKVIRAIAFGAQDPQFVKDAAFEMECSRAAGDVMGVKPQGIMVPHDVLGKSFITPSMIKVMTPQMLRVLTAGTATDGAELVADNLLAGSFIDVLRNLAVVMSFGPTVLDGLVGDVLIPRKTSGSAGGWIATEGGDAASSEAQFDQVPLTPKTVGAYSTITRQLLMQSTPAIEGLIRDDLAKAIAIAIDLAALYGSGASGQPTGISVQTGINEPTAFVGAVPTWLEVIALESAVAVDNALFGNLAYIMEPAMRGSLKGTAKAGTFPIFVIGDDNTMNGYPIGVTSQITSGDIFFGNFADLVLGFWGGLDITIDPYTAALSGSIRMIALQSMDVAVRHPVSFAFNNDTP